MAKEKDVYTPTEVGVLVESFQSQMSFVSERVGTLCEDMTEVKGRLSAVETRLTSLEDVVRLTLPRITKLESKL